MILITASEKKGQNNEEVEMKVNLKMNNASGYLFYIINKWNGPTRYIPIYKSEIKPE